MTAAVPTPLSPEVRVYAAITAASAVVISLILAQRGDATLALLPLLLAALGLLLRRTSAPGLAVLVACYLMVYPYGTPFTRLQRLDIAAIGVRLPDVVFVAAVLAYLTAQFRLFSLTVRAVPDERANYAKKSAEPPTVRPAETQTDDELFRMGALLMAALMGGTVLWFAGTKLQVNLDGWFPFKPASSRRSDMLNRGAVLLLLVGVPALALRFVFWFRRWSTLTRDEAGLAALDTAWQENRRELARQETWHAWGRGVRPKGRFPWRFVFSLLLGLMFLGCVYAVLMVVVDSLTGF